MAEDGRACFAAEATTMRVLSLALAGVLLIAAATSAQILVDRGYRHASTVQEGARRGMADVIRSRGAANLMNSQAAKNYEDARKKNIDNRLHATQTYFDMKRVNKQYRDAQRKPPPTQEQLIRFSKQNMPARLSSNKVDPLTGTVEWPVALREASMAKDRTKVEKLFSTRANYGYLNATQHLQVKQATDSLRRQLRAIGRSFPSNVRIEGRKFLDSIDYEASLQAG